MALYVNGEKIEESAIKEEVEQMRPHYQQVFRDQTPEEQEARLWEWARENVIEKVLVKQAAKADPRPINPEEVEKSFKDLKKRHGGDKAFYKQLGLKPEDDPKIKEDLELQMRVERLFKENIKDLPEPTEEEAREYYDSHIDEFMTPEQVRAAHIVKHVDGTRSQPQAYKEILEVQKKLEEGAIFEELADRESDCPGNGGDLGYFTRGQMVQEFEDAVFALQIGQVSGIIHSSYGYHIAKLYDRRPPQPIPFEQVKDQILEYLKREKEEKKNEEFIDQLKEKAVIEEK